MEADQGTLIGQAIGGLISLAIGGFVILRIIQAIAAFVNALGGRPEKSGDDHTDADS